MEMGNVVKATYTLGDGALVFIAIQQIQELKAIYPCSELCYFNSRGSTVIPLNIVEQQRGICML